MNNYWEPKANAAISIRIHFGKSLRGDRQWKHPLTVHYKPLLICKSLLDVCCGEIRKYSLAPRPIPSYIIYKLTEDRLAGYYCLIGRYTFCFRSASAQTDLGKWVRYDDSACCCRRVNLQSIYLYLYVSMCMCV